MPRFNAKRWSPSRDSSVRHFQTAVKDKQVHLDVAYRPGDEAYGCPCGCGGWPKGSKARFVMGHDARYRGILIRAYLTGTPVVRHLIVGESDTETTAADAMTLATIEGVSFVAALQEADLRRDSKNREVLAKAISSKRLIKVGRWEYTGQVVAVYGENGDQEYDVEYVTKMGEIRRKRLPAADTKEATE